jgi:hypothetical protein
VETEDMWNNMKFPCSVSISIRFGITENPDPESVMASVVSVLKKHRWRGVSRDTPALKLRWNGPDRRGPHTIDPMNIELIPIDGIRPAQLRAFCQYIDAFGPKLVRSMAWRKISGVREINTAINFRAIVRKPNVNKVY